MNGYLNNVSLFIMYLRNAFVTVDTVLNGSDAIPMVRYCVGCKALIAKCIATLRNINSGIMLTPKPFATIAITEISSLSVYFIFTGTVVSFKIAQYHYHFLS